MSDSLSGSGSISLLAATSNEPDNGLGDGDTANDIQGWDLGTPDTSGHLRTERAGNGMGRIYTLRYQGSDRAGNSATCPPAVNVPRDQGQR